MKDYLIRFRAFSAEISMASRTAGMSIFIFFSAENKKQKFYSHVAQWLT